LFLLFDCMVFLYFYYYTDKPETAVTQSSFTSSVGSALSLECKTNANPVPTSYKWTRAGLDISVTSRTHSITVESGTLSYACVATNSIGTSSSISFTVSGTTNVGVTPRKVYPYF